MKLFAIWIALCAFVYSEGAMSQSARSWQKYQVPGAVCGSGEPYNIFISRGNVNKVVIAFQGGGACWSQDSCFGLVRFADLRAIQDVEDDGGMFSTDATRSPASNYSMVYLPYCTGDVFSGNHVAQYGQNAVHHKGLANFQLVLRGLQQYYRNLFSNAQELIVYGYSAGAIGALVHARTINYAFGDIPKKTLLLDSPGLHFGPTFWHKFTPALIADYKRAIDSLGMNFNYNDGVIAEAIPRTCETLPAWKVGVMQATKDRIMSLVFGDIGMTAHQQQVLGPRGIYEITKNPNDNCSAWVPTSGIHTFLSEDKDNLPEVEGVSAVSFAYRMVGDGSVPSYRTRPPQILMASQNLE